MIKNAIEGIRVQISGSPKGEREKRKKKKTLKEATDIVIPKTSFLQALPLSGMKVSQKFFTNRKK